MIGNKNIKVFGPGKSAFSHSSTPVYQKGEGLASFFSSLFRKALPFLTKTVKKVASSNVVKDIGKNLSKHGSEAAVNIAADLIGGTDPSIKAKEKLAEARQDIANVIRSGVDKKKKKDNTQGRGTKRKKAVVNNIRKKKSRNYSIFEKNSDKDE